MKVLIIDDSPVMRRIVRHALHQAGLEGHDCDEAEDGRRALEWIEQRSYDLILSDWNMPHMTGIELLETLHASGKRIPFCFVTSDVTPAMRERASAAGAHAFVTKPFTPASIAAALRGVLG